MNVITTLADSGYDVPGCDTGVYAATRISSVTPEDLRAIVDTREWHEIPVRNLASDGTPLLDPSGVPDTSFLVRFPANIPYLMQGIDCEGHTLNTRRGRACGRGR